MTEGVWHGYSGTSDSSLSHSRAYRLPRESRAVEKPTSPAPARRSTWSTTTSHPRPLCSRQVSPGHTEAGTSARRPTAEPKSSGGGGDGSDEEAAPAERCRLRRGGAGCLAREEPRCCTASSSLLLQQSSEQQ